MWDVHSRTDWDMKVIRISTSKCALKSLGENSIWKQKQDTNKDSGK